VNFSFILSRCYCTSNFSKLDISIPVLDILYLHFKGNRLFKCDFLIRKSIYSFFNKINSKQWTGSVKYLYLILNKYIVHRIFNINIVHRIFNKVSRTAISKDDLDNFNFSIYLFFTYKNKAIRFKLLTEL
jgi:hypothetical protein